MPIAIEMTQGRRSGKLDVAALRDEALFAQVPPADLDLLARRGSWRVYRRHDEIAVASTDDEIVHLVAGGLVGLGAMSPLGKQYIGILLGRGDHFALAGLPRPLAELAHAMAMSDECIVFRLPADEFAHLGAKHSVVASAIEEYRLHWLHELAAVHLDHVLFDARARLGHTLARLARRDPAHIVRFSRRELSWMSGLCREDVTRYLGQFQRRALVHFEPRRSDIHVLEPGTLEREGYGMQTTAERSLV